MRYRVRITHKAEADIDATLLWFHSIQASAAGEKWLRKLLECVETLKANPDRCSVSLESTCSKELIRDPIRELLVGNSRFKHRILFQVTGQTVTILRIWHSSRDKLTAEELME